MNVYKYIDDNGEHLHELNGIPLVGVSTVSKILGIGSALAWWASARAVESLGWSHSKETPQKERIKKATVIHSKIKTSGVEEYLKLLDEAYKAHSVKLKDTAKDGTDMHAELEHFIQAEMKLKPHKLSYLEKIQPFIDWSNKNVKRFLWSEGHCYSDRLWVGGICDFGVVLNDGRMIVGDFKSSKSIYINHYIQCAGYVLLIEENGLFDMNGKQILKLEKKIDGIMVVAFGAKEVIPQEPKEELSKFKTAFEHCVFLHKLNGGEQ